MEKIKIDDIVYSKDYGQGIVILKEQLSDGLVRYGIKFDDFNLNLNSLYHRCQNGFGQYYYDANELGSSILSINDLFVINENFDIKLFLESQGFASKQNNIFEKNFVRINIKNIKQLDLIALIKIAINLNY